MRKERLPLPLRIFRSLLKHPMLMSMLSVGGKGEGQKLTLSPNIDCSAFGATLMIIRLWKARLVGPQK